MPHCRRQPAAFTLVELLIVIALMGILVGLVLPSSEPNVNEQLRAVARTVRTDLAYARSLAVANNSTYRVSFDFPNNRYVLQHSGTNPALDTLPPSPFRSPGDPANQQVVKLSELPHVGPTVRLVTAAASATSMQQVGDVSFGPLGETTRSGWTLLWLAAGSGSSARYVELMVNPVTGLAEAGSCSQSGPPSWLLPP